MSWPDPMVVVGFLWLRWLVGGLGIALAAALWRIRRRNDQAKPAAQGTPGPARWRIGLILVASSLPLASGGWLVWASQRRAIPTARPTALDRVEIAGCPGPSARVMPRAPLVVNESADLRELLQAIEAARPHRGTFQIFRGCYELTLWPAAGPEPAPQRPWRLRLWLRGRRHANDSSTARPTLMRIDPLLPEPLRFDAPALGRWLRRYLEAHQRSAEHRRPSDQPAPSPAVDAGSPSASPGAPAPASPPDSIGSGG
jgi:hypothetical protein